MDRFFQSTTSTCSSNFHIILHMSQMISIFFLDSFGLWQVLAYNKFISCNTGNFPEAITSKGTRMSACIFGEFVAYEGRNTCELLSGNSKVKPALELQIFDDQSLFSCWVVLPVGRLSSEFLLLPSRTLSNCCPPILPYLVKSWYCWVFKAFNRLFFFFYCSQVILIIIFQV